MLGAAEADSVSAGLALVTSSFLRLIKMIIAPLVFSTLVVGIARMEGVASMARIGVKTLGWFVVATLISMSIGLAVVQVFKPGAGLSPLAASAGPAEGARLQLEIGDMLDHTIPSSIVQAMAGNEILQIVVFSVLFGAAAGSLGLKVKGLIDALDQFAAVILKLTRYIMALAPLAIFTALAATVLTQGSGVLLGYARYLGSFYVALALLWVFFGAVLYFHIGRLAPAAAEQHSRAAVAGILDRQFSGGLSANLGAARSIRRQSNCILRPALGLFLQSLRVRDVLRFRRAVHRSNLSR